ncbi:ATP-binding protein [uncultured Jannaschia sp.]|uniref:ATP-binding protein n=1 Tax=uncultured Jannaschia sp. TaxID=293347 RepID=UPI002632DB6E|nr:ATP-binding protein [uncultured Jannaschia sp.]
MKRQIETSPGVFLLTARPGSAQVRTAVGVVVVLLLVLMTVLPFANTMTSNTAFILPAYAMAVLVVELITAVMLLAQFAVQPSPSLLLPGAAYTFSGLMIFVWMMSFPDFATPLGLDPGPQGTAFLAALRRLVFPLLLLAYALSKDRGRGADRSGRVWIRIAATLVGSTIAVALSAWITFEHNSALPQLMMSETEVNALWRYVPASALVIYALLIASLLRRRRSVLDLWLVVVTCSLTLEVILLFYATGGTRFSLGWWIGRSCGLVSSSVVLVALLAETTTLYARLARSAAEERRVRESRLRAMEAMSATLAHEINQPLTSISTNAAAGLRWLDRSEPDLTEARDALSHIIAEGKRAGDVVTGIRTMFKKSAREHVAFDLGSVLSDSVTQSQDAACRSAIAIECRASEEARFARGNRIQISQVICNLVANAIDAITLGPPDSLRTIRIRAEPEGRDFVVISVSDTGIGMDPETRQSIFEPFYTTKPNGMGMGLMFSQSIVEAHGGQIWADANRPRGSIVSFTLPIR